MRRIARTMALCLALSQAAIAAQAAGGAIGPLVSTSWKQRDAYAAFCPVDRRTGERQRLGCWSVAFAQILFHHRLSPKGSTTYESPPYGTVGADFDAAPVDLAFVVPILDEKAMRDDGSSGRSLSRETARETARYLWYAALVTGKLFGTGSYLGNSDLRRERIERHYGVSTKRLRTPESTEADFEAFMRSELEAGCPLLLYVEGTEEGQEGFGHALVIDGIRSSGKGFQVHLNFGWEGVGDGWYPFMKVFKTPYGTFDKPDRWVLAIRPK